MTKAQEQEYNFIKNIVYFDLHEKLYYKKIKVDNETFKSFITDLYDNECLQMTNHKNDIRAIYKSTIKKIDNFVKELKGANNGL